MDSWILMMPGRRLFSAITCPLPISSTKGDPSMDRSTPPASVISTFGQRRRREGDLYLYIHRLIERSPVW